MFYISLKKKIELVDIDSLLRLSVAKCLSRDNFSPAFCLLYITAHAKGPHEKPCGASSGKLAQILPFAQRFSFVTVVFINEICFLFQFIKIMYVQEVLTNII